MKFKYQHRNTLVPVFVAIAVGLLVMFITLIAINNKLFTSKIPFYFVMSSAEGLQKHPAIKFKGLEVGKISDFSLNSSNNVIVNFYIYNNFRDKVVQYSVLSPVYGITGEMTHFELVVPKYSEKNILVQPNELVPYVNSELGRKYVDDGSIVIPEEGFGGIMSKLNEILEGLTTQRTVYKLDTTIKNLSDVLATVNSVLSRVDHTIAGSSAPEGILGRVGGDAVTKSMNRLEHILGYLEETLAVLHQSRKEIAPMISNLNETIKKLNNTLKGVNNNPLIKGGIPKEKKYTGVELND